MKLNVKSIFAKVLPTIAATMGGPLAQMGANAVLQALGGGKVEATPGGVDAAILEAQKTNPNVLEDLKKVDADLQVRLAQMGYDSEEAILRLANEDRASARAREVAVKDRLPALLAIGVTVFFFIAILVIRAKGVPDSAHDTILQMVEAIKIAWISIISYYFGSSSGSAKKTEILAGQSPSDK